MSLLPENWWIYLYSWCEINYVRLWVQSVCEVYETNHRTQNSGLIIQAHPLQHATKTWKKIENTEKKKTLVFQRLMKQ